MSSKYYDGTKLLSLNDLNGEKPEIYICTTNRTGGKTTWFGRYLIKRYINNNEKFCLVYRFNYELDECANKFFKDIGNLFFQGYEMTSKRIANGIFHELYLNDKCCGYAVSLNNADQIKKYSHIFNDVKRMLFDEFQSETNHYCSQEITKFISVHTSIARGNGEQIRYVPVYMIANPITLLNPYYVEMGISDRLKNDTKFLKGCGYVLEQGFVESASKAQQESGFNKAFSQNKYVGYSSQGIYLNDNSAFIEKVTGKSRYLATLKYCGCEYAVREFDELGIIYCDDKPDTTFKYKISVTTDDHNINYVILKKESAMLQAFKWYFDNGCFRFKNLKCKQVIFKTLSY